MQTPPSPAPDNAVSALDPEDAFLSPTCYSNAYFGFAFDLPPDAKLRPIAVPAAIDSRIQLLDMVGSPPYYPAISISAYEYKNKNYTDAKGLLRHQLDQNLLYGVEELHGLAKTNLGGRQFYYFETRRGAEQHMELAAEMNGYVLYVVLKANDPQLVRSLVSAFYRVQFFPAEEAAKHAGPAAADYHGPAISSRRLREIVDSAPAAFMDSGEIEGRVYRNAQIGFTYEFPKGWTLHAEGAIEPAVARYHEKATGDPMLGPRERALVKACRKTLLSFWKTRPDADGQVPYDEFGEVTLSAMPMSCIPNVHFPDDPKDAAAIRRFIVSLSLTEPLQRDMNEARSHEAGGKNFVLTHGTIAYKEAGDALSRRISVATALTEQRGYLLIWLFAAPHDAELRELLNAKMGFDIEPASKEAATGKRAGDGAEPAAPPNPGSTAPQSGTADPSAAPSSASSSTSAPATTGSASQAYSRPTLLRKGENMESQQMQGKPLPPKKPN